MSIEKISLRGTVLAVLAVLAFGNLRPLLAATVEEENWDDPLSASTPAIHPAAKSPEPVEWPGKLATSPRTAKVRIDDVIGFYYFFKSGFIAPDESRLSWIGQVADPEDALAYTTPKKAFIDLRSSRYSVKPGDMLVVFRATERLEEPKSGFSGRWVDNLALVQVIEVQKGTCQVQIKQSFAPFNSGDKVKPFEGEIDRWKEAHVRKALPEQPVHCAVAGGDPSVDYYHQPDFIVLTAGSNKGVVEGQTFELRRDKDRGLFKNAEHVLKGRAKVFFVGSNYSMAQIIESRESIQRGFEADYRP